MERLSKMRVIKSKKFVNTIVVLIFAIILSIAVIFTGNVKKSNSVSETSATEPTESVGITQETEAGEENQDENSVESVVTDESTISSGSNSMSNDSQEKNSSNSSTGDAASKSDYETDIMTNDDSGADDSAVSPDSSNVQNVPNSGTGAKVRFTYPDRSYVDKPLSDFDTDTYDNENVKVLTYEAVPAKLTEKVDISIIKSDGTQSNSYVFSPADYLDEFLSGQDENGIIVKQKAIAKALLNYGAYAQLYFDEKTSDLANKNLTDNAVETLYVDDILKNTVDEDTSKLDNGDLEYIGTSLICTDETAMKVYFVNKNQLTLDQIKQKYDIKVNGDSPYASNCNYETTLNGSLMCVKLKGLHPYMLSSNYTVMLTDKNSSDTAEGVVSPYSYIRKAVQGKDEKLANLCKAMYLY